jgi:DNA-directed RNA polymerase specialized sigma24 family protein
VADPPAPHEALALSHEDFTDAVRHALRHLHRPELLARNPLLRTRLAREHAGREPAGAATVADLLRTAVDTLREHPRDDKLLRAVERTYLRPAPTQEAAADVLGLPFSTYRRHLTSGIQRLTEILWRQEVGES